MAQTTTELYNLAAQAVGARGKLVSTSQASRFTDVFGLWLPSVRAVVLQSSHWPSAKKTASLSPIAERDNGVAWAAGAPKPGAKYAYLAPSDLLHPRHLSTYGHFDMEMIGDSRAIHAHEPQAILTYTFDQTNESLWEPELFLLMAIALGAYTAQTLTGKRSLSASLEKQANEMITRAQARSLAMHYAPVSAVASWHSARGYAGRPDVARYVYPLGSLIAVGESANVK